MSEEGVVGGLLEGMMMSEGQLFVSFSRDSIGVWLFFYT